MTLKCVYSTPASSSRIFCLCGHHHVTTCTSAIHGPSFSVLVGCMFESYERRWASDVNSWLRWWQLASLATDMRHQRRRRIIYSPPACLSVYTTHWTEHDEVPVPHARRRFTEQSHHWRRKLNRQDATLMLFHSMCACRHYAVELGYFKTWLHPWHTLAFRSFMFHKVV